MTTSEQTIIAKFTVLQDTISDELSYLGLAKAGSATSASVWEISKIIYDTDGNLVSQEWANANGNFDNVWDNRLDLNYS